MTGLTKVSLIVSALIALAPLARADVKSYACPQLAGQYTCADEGISISITQTPKAETSEFVVHITRKGQPQPMDHGDYIADGKARAFENDTMGSGEITAFCTDKQALEIQLHSDVFPPAYGEAQRFTPQVSRLEYASGTFVNGTFNPSQHQITTCSKN